VQSDKLGLSMVTSSNQPDRQPVACHTHGSGLQAFVCNHLLSNPSQEWFSQDPDVDNPWPDAWCSVCDAIFLQEGEWNERNEPKIEIQLVCHHCYEMLRSKAQPDGS
jgi:hypothetical protein